MLLFTLLAQISFGLIAMTICLPSMQEWGDVFGASQARVQLTFSGYVLAFGLFQLVYGPLSDRHGRRGVLLTGLALLGLGSLMAALAPNLDVLIAARVLQGAGSAAGIHAATNSKSAASTRKCGRSRERGSCPSSRAFLILRCEAGRLWSWAFCSAMRRAPCPPWTGTPSHCQNASART